MILSSYHPCTSRGMDSRLKCNTGFFIQKGFIWSEIPQTLSRRIIDKCGQFGKFFRRQGLRVCFSRQEAPHAPDRVFNAAFLPWRVRVAKPGMHAAAVCEPVMPAEFGAIIECDGLAFFLRHLSEEQLKIFRHGFSP